VADNAHEGNAECESSSAAAAHNVTSVVDSLFTGVGNDADEDGIMNDRVVHCPGRGGIDAKFASIVGELGASMIDEELFATLSRLNMQHPFLRELFLSHRSFDDVLLDYENNGTPFYLYTGRGPSASMHVAHLVPFLFTAHLQQSLGGLPVVIQITDDEKFLYHKRQASDAAAGDRETEIDYEAAAMEEIARHSRNNIRDILACGFDLDRTYVFTNFGEIGELYPQICRIQRHLTINQLRSTFGISPSDNPGKLAFPATEMAPALPSTFADTLFRGQRLRCVVPCGIDQDPYFRLTRDVASKMREAKPSVLHAKFLPSLEGVHTKMSSSVPAGAVNLDDEPATVRDKFNRAFSGGRRTMDEHRRLGADLAVDVPVRYYRCFAPLAPVAAGEAETAAATVERNVAAYSRGELGSGAMKRLAADAVIAVLERHRAARAAITHADVERVMTRRPLLY